MQTYLICYIRENLATKRKYMQTARETCRLAANLEVFDAELAVLQLMLAQHVICQLLEHGERLAGLAARTVVGQQQGEGAPHALVLQRQLVLVLVVQGAHVHGAERTLLAGKHRLKCRERWRIREMHTGISRHTLMGRGGGRLLWYVACNCM